MIVILDPLLGREVDVSDRVESLHELKKIALSLFDVTIPPSDQEFIDRVTLSVSGKKIETDADVAVIPEGARLVFFVRPKLAPRTDEDVEDVEDVDAVEEDEMDKLDREVDNLFRIRRSRMPLWLRRFILETIKIPEWIIAPLTHTRLKHIVMFASWLAGSKMSSMYSLGPIWLLGTLFFLIFANLSNDKRPGEWSAYSLFNPGGRRIAGTLDAGHVARTGGLG
jgi:hypothetical protein